MLSVSAKKVDIARALLITAEVAEIHLSVSVRGVTYRISYERHLLITWTTESNLQPLMLECRALISALPGHRTSDEYINPPFKLIEQVRKCYRSDSYCINI